MRVLREDQWADVQTGRRTGVSGPTHGVQSRGVARGPGGARRVWSNVSGVAPGARSGWEVTRLARHGAYRSSCVCLCRGQMRVGATSNALEGAHCARTLVASGPMLASVGYIGQMMSVHAAPPPDSYCTGRLGSLVRHQAAIAWVRGSALLWACCTHPMLYHAARHVRPEALDAGQAPERPRIGTMGGRNVHPLILCDLANASCVGP